MVAAGQHHSLALNLHGTELYAFGRADYGQLGIGKRRHGEFVATPTLVRFPSKSASDPTISPEEDVEPYIVHIACGDSHSMALTMENELYTWGFNDSGATGHECEIDDKGDVADIYVPTLLGLENHIQTQRVPYCLPYEMSGGGQHSMALVKRYQSKIVVA
jgi:alpha-tubulin suppressor-like RCC1 family protein